MATFSAGPNGIDMNTLTLPNAVVTRLVMPAQITTTLQNGAVEYYNGSFFAPTGTLNSGTATSYERDFTNNGGNFGGDPYGYGGYNPGVATVVFSITGANVSAAQINQDLAAPNSGALLQSFLAGHDTYIGSSATDVLVGQGGNDTFIGGSTGTETFIPAAGNNTITGGSGMSTVQFKGPASDYMINSNGDGSVTVTDSVASRNGTDHISSVQFLQFTDHLDVVANGSQAQIALLYQGALGRIPDAPGLTGWENIYASESQSARDSDNFTSLAGTPVNGLPNLASGFTQSTEFQQKYGSLTDSQFVTQLYANVLDRAPDAAGLNGWVSALTGGQTREWVLVGFALSDEALHNAEVGYVGQSGSHPGWLTVI